MASALHICKCRVPLKRKEQKPRQPAVKQPEYSRRTTMFPGTSAPNAADYGVYSEVGKLH